MAADDTYVLPTRRELAAGAVTLTVIACVLVSRDGSPTPTVAEPIGFEAPAAAPAAPTAEATRDRDDREPIRRDADDPTR